MQLDCKGSLIVTNKPTKTIAGVWQGTLDFLKLEGFPQEVDVRLTVSQPDSEAKTILASKTDLNGFHNEQLFFRNTNYLFRYSVIL